MQRLPISVDACVEVMGLLIAMAWADGELNDEEIEGLRSASQTLNLGQEQRMRMQTFMLAPPSLDQLQVEALSPRGRDFAYVASVWMARMAEGIDHTEAELLQALAVKLELSEKRQEELADIALDVYEEEAPDDGASWAGCIDGLFKAISLKVQTPL